MLKEVSKEEAKKMALEGQEVIKIYPGCDGSRVQGVNKAIDDIFDDSSRFLVDFPEEPSPQKHPGGRKPTIDVGKLRALYNAGWDNKKIADEMHISASAVSSYCRKFREEEE